MASKWASPSTVGQDGTIEECLSMYADYVSSSSLREDLDELLGLKLLSDTPLDKPCTADILVAMVYHSRIAKENKARRRDARPGTLGQPYSDSWSRKALCLMAATHGP